MDRGKACLLSTREQVMVTLRFLERWWKVLEGVIDVLFSMLTLPVSLNGIALRPRNLSTVLIIN